MANLVLIHGAWHGGWCWDLLAAELADHTVAAPNLPGHGGDPLPVTQVTLARYVERVVATVRTQAERHGPVTLVGHSMGGIVISQAAEVLARDYPGTLSGLIYLAAFLIPDGTCLLDANVDDPESLLRENRVLNEARTQMTIRAEGAAETFYGDCSDDLVRWAVERLVPQSLSPLTTPLALSDAHWGSLPRAYIQCLRDRALGPQLQARLVEGLPCKRLVALESSHSPFFSMPARLAAVLGELATDLADHQPSPGR